MKTMSSMSPDLIYNFDCSALLETEFAGRWVEVSPYIFRSCSGLRRIDGEGWHDTVYILGTNKVYDIPDLYPCPYTHSHTRHWCGYPQCRDS